MGDGHLEQVRRALAANAVFGVLDPAQIGSLVAYGATTRHAAGETIFRRGDPGESMMVVLGGRVRISNFVPDGKEAILDIIEAGDVFGEVALLDGKPRSADAAAAEPCTLFVLRRRELLPFLEAHPAVTVRLVEVLCERLRRVTEIVEDIMFLNTGPRIAKALLRLAEEHGTRRPGVAALSIDLRISQTDLGGHVGLSRESVNRQLQSLRRAGILAVEDGHLTILQPARLQALAQG